MTYDEGFDQIMGTVEPPPLPDPRDVEIGRLRSIIQDACDLLAERTHGNPARSPGHNARLCLEAALTPKREETR